MSTTLRSDRSPPAPDEETRILGSDSRGSGMASAYPFLRPPAAPGEVGRLGGYRVLRLLGAGGMGKVFLAEDLTLRRLVALKVMCLPLGEDLQCGWERFLREARALAAINHPNLVAVYQTGQDRGTYFLAMELLEGETLDARVRRDSPMDVSEIVRVAEEVAKGLAAIHDRGLIHRDIKPSNIWLVAQAGQDTAPMGEGDEAPPPFAGVKILDFGLVREINADTQLTEAGAVVGTPAYMSLEQARGHPLDHRTDLFSFGCVLYAMCTGRVPFGGSNPMAQAAALATDEPVRARKLNKSIPSPLSDLISDLLAKDPQDRPNSAAAVIERLRRMECADSRASGTAPRRERSRTTFARRHAAPLVAVVTLVWLAAAGLVVVALTRGPRERDEKHSVAAGSAVPASVGSPEVYLHTLQKADEYPFPPPGMPGPPGHEKVVRVEGEPSEHGIFMHGAPPHHPHPRTHFALDGEYSRFTAKVAMNDWSNEWTSMTFVVSADGKQVWESGDLRAGGGPASCELDVGGVRQLTLEVRTRGPHHRAHGAWIAPRVTK